MESAMSDETYPGPGDWPAEVTPDGIEDIRLARISAGALAADAELAKWLLADPDRANSAGIVVIFANAMIRAAAAEPAVMLDKLYTFASMLDALCEYVETGASSWEGSPWDALAGLVS